MRLLIALLLWAGAAGAQSCLCLTCPLTGERMYLNTSSHMHPTLAQGECVTLRPVSGLQPSGSIVLFEGEDGFDYIFRIVAGPGDRVQMVDGALILNGVPVETQRAPDFIETAGWRDGTSGFVRCPQPVADGATCRIPRRIETLPNGAQYQVLDLGSFGLDNTRMFTVPPGHVFVLGDNRDNATDSRVSSGAGGRGFVPIASIRMVLD